MNKMSRIEDFNRLFGDKVKETLDESGRTARWLSEQTGITESNISHYINGTRTPRIDNVSKIAIALDLSIDCMLGIK